MYGRPVAEIVIAGAHGFCRDDPVGRLQAFLMLSVVKNVEFCSSFLQLPDKQSLKIIWKQTSESRILKTGYVHDHVHAHVHVDDHVLVIVVVDVNVIVVLDGFVSQPGHWNKVRHE